MLIYRVEDEDGRGPYRVGHLSFSNRHYNGDDCPDPFSDFSTDGRNLSFHLSSWYYFGFDSIEKLSNWFDKEDRYMLYDDCSCRWRISVYDVPVEFVHVSNKQAIFVKKRARKIKYLSIIHFREI